MVRYCTSAELLFSTSSPLMPEQVVRDGIGWKDTNDRYGCGEKER
jgi:hypothetical protein